MAEGTAKIRHEGRFEASTVGSARRQYIESGRGIMFLDDDSAAHLLDQAKVWCWTKQTLAFQSYRCPNSQSIDQAYRLRKLSLTVLRAGLLLRAAPTVPAAKSPTPVPNTNSQNMLRLCGKRLQMTHGLACFCTVISTNW